MIYNDIRCYGIYEIRKLSMLIATIDGGTTNTRVRIWRASGNETFVLVSEASSEIGVRNTAIDGHNKKLLTTIDSLLREAGSKAGVSGSGQGTLSLILASGMLTSNLGIAEIPHISAPADLPALADAMVCREIPGLENKKIWFVPGIKNRSETGLTEETLPLMDMMRGEETEAAGLLAACPLSETADALQAKRSPSDSTPDGKTPAGSRILVLPGSHNKYIAVDEAGRIQGCFTTLAGELLHSLTLDSILADSVAKGFAEEFEPAAFLRGADWGGRMGVGHGAFLCRICDLFDHYSPLQARNYLLGLLLADDLSALKKDPLSGAMLADKSVCFIVAGRRVMQEAYICLLGKEGYRVTAVPQELQTALSGKGALELARLRGLIKYRSFLRPGLY